jgi:NodT family efflux transporter outer membrane factor (OMF) lipoprotein
MHKIGKVSLGIALVLGAILTGSPAVGQQPGSRERPEQQSDRETGSAFWYVLNDTTLDRLMKEALRGNHVLKSAAARRDGAGALQTQAALNLVPAVTANAGYTRRRLASSTFPGAGLLPDQDLWDSGLNASWELDLFGRLRGGLRAQNALLGQATEDLRDVQVAVAADLARNYFALRGAQEQLAVARRNAENQGRTLELTQQRLDAGRGTAFDTERARTQHSLTLAAIPALEARVAALQYRIAALVGREPQLLAAELANAGPLPGLPDTVPASSTADVVIQARPDVRSAELNVAATRALVSSARADYLPRLSLSAGAGYTASTVSRFGNDGTFNYVFGPVISWPAFDIGRVKARVDEAQAQESVARARYEQTVLEARAELETASVRYQTARARLGHLRAAAEASERAAGLARMRYEGGVADFLQVLDAERTLLAAQDQLAQGRSEAAEAYVALFKARGESW